MKKICLLVHSLDIKRGGGRLSLDLVENLNKNKIETRVLTSLGTGFDKEESILYTDKLRLLLSLGRIRKIIKECDVVHALDVFPFGIIAVVASLGLKKKIVITAVGSSSIRPLYRFGISTLSKLALKRADALTAISNYVAGEVNRKISNLNFEIIIPGINYDYFVNKPPQIGTVKESPYILSVAKLKPRKGHHVSLRVFAKIADKLPHIKYVIVGNGRGKYYEEIKQLIRELKIEDRIIFKQNISDEELVQLYKNAEIFILLPQNDDYDIEGFGLVYVEAAAFGLPVIGCLNSGAEDAVLDKQNGFLVKSSDIDGASEKILEIINNNSLKLKFSKESIDFAKRNDWGNIIKYYLEIYKNL